MTEKIRTALETHLASMSPALATAPENVAYTPVTGTPYQQPRMLYAEPDNIVLGCQYRREQGIFQVLLSYPVGAGPGAAQARADAIREHFKRGTTLTFSGQGVMIPRTPRKTTLGVDGDRYKVAVSVPFWGEIFG